MSDHAANPDGRTSMPADLPRREVLVRSSQVLTGLAAAVLGWPGSARTAEAASRPDVHLELRAEPGEVSIRPGPPTRVWRYRGRVLRGDAAAIDDMAGSYLGPIIRVRRGQRVRIDLVDGLPEPTIIHWHGLHVPDDMDGHPAHIHLEQHLGAVAGLRRDVGWLDAGHQGDRAVGVSRAVGAVLPDAQALECGVPIVLALTALVVPGTAGDRVLEDVALAAVVVALDERVRRSWCAPTRCRGRCVRVARAPARSRSRCRPIAAR